MGHHSSEHPLFQSGKFETDDRTTIMRKLLNTTGFIGATGLHPNGQLGPHDEGELRFAAKVVDGKIILDFGKPVHSIGMTPQQAADMASDLIRMARGTARSRGQSIAVSI